MYFVSLKYPGKKAVSHHEFVSFEEAMRFSVPNIDRFNISICEGGKEDDKNLKEIISFRWVK